MKEVKDIIKSRRIELGLTQLDVAKAVEVSEGTVSRWEAGEISNMRRSRIAALARVLKISPSIILGYEDTNEVDSSTLNVPNLFKIETKKFPLLGNIACGEPIFASEGFDAYIEAGADIQADFCLKAKGDSMTGARICDGDIVFIRKQDMVDDGEIAAVLIDDDATLKRVFYDREANIISLFAENPNYKTMRFSGEELNRIRILGKAIAFQSDIK